MLRAFEHIHMEFARYKCLLLLLLLTVQAGLEKSIRWRQLPSPECWKKVPLQIECLILAWLEANYYTTIKSGSLLNCDGLHKLLIIKNSLN